MNQEKKKAASPQVFYNDRWVDKNHFTAFVYNATEQRLAKSYQEYETYIATGLWFDTKSKAMEVKPQAEILELKKPQARKPKNGANS